MAEPRLRPLVTAVLLALLALAACAGQAFASAATVPPEKALYADGPSGRFLLDGAWMIRRDPTDTGIAKRWYAPAAGSGWHAVSVPNAWNAGDNSVASMIGEPVWYRKDFQLPDASSGLTWLLHFDSVNYRATVWLNGRLLGHHTGSYLPFELPAAAARRGVNHLVVRVDNRLLPTDFPPSLFSRADQPHEGWWNYGGIPRSVYLRRVDRVDFSQVQVRPVLPCPACAATIQYAVTVHNYAHAAEQVHLGGAYGPLPVDLGQATIAPEGSHQFTANLPVPTPHLWSPADPYLYTATLDATIGGATVGHYTLLSGVRSITVGPDGRLLLNGQHLNFRGVAVEEDSPTRGNALTTGQRDQIFAWVKQLGATEIRDQYPLDPYMFEQADKLGILVWTEIPVYRMDKEFLGMQSVQTAAVGLLRENIVDNQNHPSVMVWSVGNENNQTAPGAEGQYIRRAAAAAKQLDPTRPVAAQVAGVPGSGCGPAYAPLDIIGLNDYYGWYGGSTANLNEISPYLDSVHACEPGKALAITEFGAEANRHGPATVKGTFEFASNWINYHLGVFASKPYLSGASYFALQEFKVRPDWDGGNPHPQPPLHQKGLVAFAGALKPAFAQVAQSYHATAQFPAP